jgi:hypothetical protein
MKQVSVSDRNYFYIISFPRSGNTWVVNTLREYLGAQRAELVPSVYGGDELLINGVLHVKTAGPYSDAYPVGIKSHMSRGEFERPNLPHNRILYLLRDVRDVMTSYYFYINGFLKKDADKVENFSARHFQEHLDARLPEYCVHVNGWLKKYQGELLPVRYEDLKSDYIGTLKAIRSFLELENIATEADVKHKYMDNFRQQDNFTNVLQGNNMDFYRKGVVGDWKNYFTDQHIATVKLVAGKMLVELGYETDQDW